MFFCRFKCYWRFNWHNSNFSTYASVSRNCTFWLCHSCTICQNWYASTWRWRFKGSFQWWLKKNEKKIQDGIFFSPHKFPGGCNTPGVLVASKKLFQNKVPHGGGGGGTIFWVSETNHRFLADAEEREEPGTPDLIGSGLFHFLYYL